MFLCFQQSVKLTVLFLLIVTVLVDLSWCKKYENRNPWSQPRFENKLDNPFHPRFQQQHKDYFLKQDERFLQDEQLSPEQALKRDPHHYRPLPLPLRDAIRYVKLYGKHSDMLKDYQRTNRYHDIGRHQRKRSQLQCKNNPRQKSESS